MKTILLTLIALAITLFSFGQAPEAFKYQAVVRDAGGAIPTNQAVGYQLSILQGSPAGTAVYTETFTLTTNAYGLVNLEIGTGTTTDDFTLIDWANGPFYMETAVDVTGGTAYAVMGTSQLVSVPYALYAKTSGSSIPGPMGPQGPAGNDGAVGATGPMGPQGPAGNDGAVGATGPQGPQGPQGPAGNDGAVGATGPMGPQGPAGNDGANGTDGQSAYEIWLGLGNTGTETDFINSLTGPQGPQGPQGPAGTTLTYSIGDTINGGIIFYLDSSNQHGLICGLSNISNLTTLGFGNYSIYGDGIGAGYMNSIFWKLAGSGGNPGTSCINYSPIYASKKYGDWYCPSLYELQLMYSHKVEIGITSGNFWSSTQNGTGTLLVNFTDGSTVTINHSTSGSGNVRAIARF